ncbi:MAG: hypothetical protein MAG551_02607 [Candidatus Scalindua arabica]|uniref:Uncharacterized protein n=1 Tax=Candidatus Scalindua arabica TaxID=1127984 RepID=A0A941W510_9BACT|nr:hypothetical protein [Candidatus Scalindua arabica]
MSYKGVVKGNVVVLEKDAKIDDGMRVVVIPEKEMGKVIDFDADPFLNIDDWLPSSPDNTPRDLANQHNHYLYGIEKK